VTIRLHRLVVVEYASNLTLMVYNIVDGSKNRDACISEDRQTSKKSVFCSYKHYASLKGKFLRRDTCLAHIYCGQTVAYFSNIVCIRPIIDTHKTAKILSVASRAVDMIETVLYPQPLT